MVEKCGARTILKEKPVGGKIEALEVPKKIFNFSPEAKAGLEKGGLVVITLTGKSILDQRKEGMKLQSDWHRDYPEFEAQRSITSEVAINPKEIFLLQSNNKPFSVQKEMVNEHSKEVSEKINGVKAIIGKLPDNLELIKKVYELYGGKNGIGDLLRERSARCAGKSPIPSIYNNEGGYGVTVGRVDPEGIPTITGRDTGSAKPNVHVIAMVVPEDLPIEEPAK